MSDGLSQPEQPGQSVLVALFRHNNWANLKLLDFCAGLSEEQLDASAVGGYGSIRDTLHHLVRAEVSYVSRVNGRLPQNPPPRKEWPGFDMLREAVRWANEELLQLALSAQADTLVNHKLDEGTEQYRLSDLLVQTISHAGEHRTQVASILTHLGLQPPDMSGWQYMDDMEHLWVIDAAGVKSRLHQQ